MSRSTGAIAAALVIASACSGGDGPEGPEGPSSLVRDSAGVRIVELPPMSDVPARYTLSDQPVYRVGWESSGRQFEEIVAGSLWSDGSAAVADAGSTLEVVALSPTGDVSAVFGGPGDGPGELRGIFSVITLGPDTVLVQDGSSRRATILTLSGEVETIRLTEVGPLRVLGVGPDRILLMGPPLRTVLGRRHETPWLAVPLVSVAPSTQAIDTVAWIDWDQSISIGGGNNPFMSGGFATVADGRFVLGVGNRPEIRWLDERGTLRQIVRWAAPPTPVPDTVFAAWEIEMRAALGRVASLPQSDIDDRMASMTEAIGEPFPYFGVPGALPGYGGLMHDLGGNVWIARYSPPRLGWPSRYYGMSREGEWLGAVDLPEGSEPLAFGTSHVLVLEQNEFDEEAVALYGLLPARE